MNRQLIYLDHAAATPVDPDVLQVMQPYFSDTFYNPSATYAAAADVRKTLEASRARIAYWLGARPSEIIFTAGGTEANNLAIHGIMRKYPEGNIAVSAVEHESVLEPARQYNYREVNVHADGRLDLQDLARKIDKNTVLVSIMYANNEVGTVQPIREIAKLIAEKRAARPVAKPLLLHTDACQAANYLDLHVARLGVDLLTINGGKIYGPKQSGALYTKAGVQLRPLIDGGGQERGLRSGTENVAAAVGLAAALDMVQADRQQEAKRLRTLQEEFFKQVEQRLTRVIINGSQRFRLPNNIHLTFPGQDNERLLIQLEEADILAAAGSACTASNEEPSHVLRALDINDQNARASLRFTMGRETTSAMAEQTIKVLSRLLSPS